MRQRLYTVGGLVSVVLSFAGLGSAFRFGLLGSYLSGSLLLSIGGLALGLMFYCLALAERIQALEKPKQERQ